MNELNQFQSEITNNLKEIIEKNSPQHELRDILNYAVLPAGKLFRPLLVYYMAKDLGEITSSHKQLACSIELHHAYTLIHDDLPAMDDDDIRRGKAATHKQFNEWKAILAGDALLGMSFGILSEIESKLPELLNIYHRYTSAQGLIFGQILDLEQDNKTLKKVLKIHKLKTARLIQLALEGSNLLSKRSIATPDCHLIGEKIGINFQLLDDLCELTEPLSDHERAVNPFLIFDKQEILNIINNNNKELTVLLEKNKLKNLQEYLETYFVKMRNILNSGLNHLSQFIVLSEDEINNFKV